MEEKQLCRHHGKQRRGERRQCRNWYRHSPAPCDEDYGEASCSPAAHGVPHRAAIYRELLKQKAPGGNCGPLRGAHAGARILTGPVDPAGSPCWSRRLWKDCSPWE